MTIAWPESPAATRTAARPEPAALAATGVGRCFGTFGELVQGVLPDGRSFLVTLPIACWSRASFTPDPHRRLRVSPGRTKSEVLARRLLEQHGLDGGGRLDISSELPVGKGLASSSADLVATARAVSAAHRLPLSAADIETLLRDIEPTDGVMYDEVVAFYHRSVRLRTGLGRLPGLTVVAVDEGGTVDTVRFNAGRRTYRDDELAEYDWLLHATEAAARAHDLELLGRLATRSACMNQARRANALLHPLLGLRRELGALGVVAAHSGTKVALLLARDDPDHRVKLARAVAACRSLRVPVSVYRTLGLDDDWRH